MKHTNNVMYVTVFVNYLHKLYECLSLTPNILYRRDILSRLNDNSKDFHLANANVISDH